MFDTMQISSVTISIHALREEGDALRGCAARRPLQISIHALREEGDGLPFPPNCESANFYPRPPRGGRPHLFACADGQEFISIHALREEGDSLLNGRFHGGKKFLSTPSARRATGHIVVVVFD